MNKEVYHLISPGINRIDLRFPERPTFEMLVYDVGLILSKVIINGDTYDHQKDSVMKINALLHRLIAEYELRTPYNLGDLYCSINWFIFIKNPTKNNFTISVDIEEIGIESNRERFILIN